jgi:hypothetical protein
MRKAAMITPMAIRKLERIKIPLPPSHLFDELLGCSRRYRFFALYWLRKAQVPILNDGRFEILGAVEPYRVWRYHPRVMAALAAYNTGDANDLAEHWILVDRGTRGLYVGEVSDVLIVLDFQQRGAIDPILEVEKADRSGNSAAVYPADMVIAAKSFKKQMRVSMKRIAELESWLAKNAGRF